jgi:hypothetical protein
MHVHQSALLVVVALSSLAALPGAFAADAPMRKSGLWEMHNESSMGGAKMPGGMSMQICIDQSKDDMTSDPSNRQDMRKRCSKMDVKRTGEKTVIDSICTFNQSTVTGHSEITGNMSTDYRIENTSRFDPPMHGMASTSSVMTGKWLGPCKPGQHHGSVVMNGMQGMPAAGYKMDPDLLKRMQQQYGQHQ